MSSWRVLALADRHRALGSKLEHWNGMGTTLTYDTLLAGSLLATGCRRAWEDVVGAGKRLAFAPVCNRADTAARLTKPCGWFQASAVDCGRKNENGLAPAMADDRWVPRSRRGALALLGFDL